MRGHYRRFAVELTLDFIAMYVVMYAMIATLRHFHFNLNNVYMTLMMLAPMSIIMLVSMRSMFPSRRLNLLIGAGAIAIFLASFAAMRTQAGVDNADFLRAMIPHHSGAILMCEQASITDVEITALCREIVASQQKEIAQMEAILARY
ncbi:DUF305 domain-containing protein [Bosea vaviloviae]|uniref:DUF305 domain-containing protein n=2 Tax=Bosea vaviloviae TaxID=1526658 RepID=A0A1D7U2K5_9HYPH|nr:DUF305 domain-containing protein [Bosea vaviloviae]